jgi:hypothetical protein
MTVDLGARPLSGLLGSGGAIITTTFAPQTSMIVGSPSRPWASRYFWPLPLSMAPALLAFRHSPNRVRCCSDVALKSPCCRAELKRTGLSLPGSAWAHT